MTPLVHHGSDLFNYDQQVCSAQILVEGEQAFTRVEYDEYVVYARPRRESDEEEGEQHSSHITHRFSQDETSGAAMLDLAFRKGFRLDQTVCRAQANAYLSALTLC